MPNKIGQIYVCEICGNKVEMAVAGKGTLHCCGQPMKLAGEKKQG
jgi:superoxide reductase